MTTDLAKSTPHSAPSANGAPITASQISLEVEQALSSIPFVDIYTHLSAPSFGNLGLWGIDELLTYHYLEAEFFRHSAMAPENYWPLSKIEKAELIWRTLFVENTPISEATRGVIAVLNAFQLPTGHSALPEARAFFQKQDRETHIQRVLQMAGISSVVMTNDPLDPEESPHWMKGAASHNQFHAVLRLDRILCTWHDHWQAVVAQGYAVDPHASGKSVSKVRRFLADWCKRMQPVYMACSLPDTFEFPSDSVGGRLLQEAVVPACRELGLPLSS